MTAAIAEEFLDVEVGRYFRLKAVLWAQAADKPIDPRNPVWPSTRSGDDVAARLGERSYVLGPVAEMKTAATLEAFTLAHHAGESLMRHFFAVLDARTNGTVPWLEMVALQEGREFRRRLKVVLKASAEDLDQYVEFLFVPPELASLMRADPHSGRQGSLGDSTGDHSADEAENDDSVAAIHRFCRAWLRHFAQKFLDSGNGYNAAKHGLSAVAGHSQLSFHVDPDSWEGPESVPEGQVILEGPQVRTIEHNGLRGEQRQWSKVTRHVDPAGLIAQALIAADLLDWLWAIEKARTRRTPAEVLVASGPLPQDVIEGRHRMWGHFRVPLGWLPQADDARDETLRRLGLLDKPSTGQA